MITKDHNNATVKNRVDVSPCSPVREFPFTDNDFKTLSDLIMQKTGILLKEHKKNMVYSRLARRLRGLGIKSFGDYLLYLSGTKGEEEISSLINAITTNLTRFFREPHHFDHLSKIVIPKAIHAIKNGEQDRIRIWSAGCSSGEEPYSIAMALDLALKQHGLEGIDAKILATDLDTNMLKIGRNGLYKKMSIATVDDKYRTFFEEVEESTEVIKVSADIRKYISFKQLNLINDWPMKGPFDAIFCRNVMIYFDGNTKAKLTEKFSQMLKTDGWLFIGHSETILGADKHLNLYGRTIYQRSL